MKLMRRGMRIMAILLSLALMLTTMFIPVAFADDNAQAPEAEMVHDESSEAEGTSLEDKAEFITPKEAKMASNINRSILIAGLDNGGRTDLMIVLCFTKENEAKIFTVARDTYMQLNPSKKYSVDGKVRDFCKCNRAGAYGGMSVLMQELNRHLDINIKEYIAADWDCVATLIDAIGGYNVNLTDKDMIDAINRLIGSKTSKVSKGKQTLNGWQTVEYLRVRKYDDGDARVREDRNRDVFVQLYNQAKGWNIDKRMLIYNAIAGKIKTNINVTELKSLISQFENVNVVKATQYPYYAKNYWDTWADMYYWTPITLEKNTIRLHKEILGQSSYAPSATVKSLSKAIAKHIKKKVIVAKKPKLPSVAKASIIVGSAAYTGKAVTPGITVKLKKKKLKATYYTVTYKNNVNIGKASLTIEGRYGYGGSKTVTFDIKPAGTRLSGITAGSKSFTTTWTAQTAMMPSKTVDGYQIQYGLKKNFKKAKTMTVSGYTNTTATVGKLKAKKKYYVRVRTYVGSGKSAVYSDWSPVMTVKPTK